MAIRSLPGVDVPAGKYQLAGLSPADKLRQQARLHARGQAEQHLRHTKPSGVGGGAHIAGGGDFEAGAEAVAVDARNHRDGRAADGLANAVGQRRAFAGMAVREGRHFRDVRAADERPVARAGQHDDAQPRVGGDCFQHLRQFSLARVAQRIPLLGVVDGDPPDAARVNVGKNHFR